MKKRILSLLIAAILIFSLAGCSVIDDIQEYALYYSGEGEAASSSAELSGDGILKVRFIDVGQGDSILIILPNGSSMLIDSGEYYAKDTVLSAVREEGLSKIDILIATHPHSDHMGSMAAIMDEIDIGRIYLPDVASSSMSFEALLDAIEAKGLEVIKAEAGMSLDVDDSVDIEILSPMRAEYDEENNYSIVLRITYGDISYLLMGDAEASVEEDILNSGACVSADVIKLGHHGSSTSSKEEFICAVSPEIAIASCAEVNSYGHPHEEVIALMEEQGITLLRTYEAGDIILSTDGDDIFSNIPLER